MSSSSISHISSSVVTLNLSGSIMITTEKLNGKNYFLWSTSVKMWFRGQGVSDHLTKKLSDISEPDRMLWDKVDVQLVTLLLQSIKPNLVPLFRVYESCVEIWTRAQKICTNDILCLYTIISTLFNLQKGDLDMETYLGKVQSAVNDFNVTLPITESITEQQIQRDKLFMVLTLVGLGANLEAVRTQILSEPVIPTLEEVFARLLWSTQTFSDPVFVVDGSTMAVSSVNRQPRVGKGKRPFCVYCRRPGHYKETCYVLHGRTPKANVSSSDASNDQVVEPVAAPATIPGAFSTPVVLSEEELTEFCQFQAARQASTSVGSVAHATGFAHTHVAGPTPSGSAYWENDWHRI